MFYDDEYSPNDPPEWFIKYKALEAELTPEEAKAFWQQHYDEYVDENGQGKASLDRLHESYRTLRRAEHKQHYEGAVNAALEKPSGKTHIEDFSGIISDPNIARQIKEEIEKLNSLLAQAVTNAQKGA